MQLPQIRMTSEMASINIVKSKGKQEIEQPKADVSIEQPKADISIETKRARLLIDQTKAWEDMNLLNVFKSTEKFANEGKAQVAEGTSRRSEEGLEMMRIENGGTPMIDQAVRHSVRPDFQLGIKFIPSHFAVKTTYEPGELNIQVKPNAPKINIQKNEPIHNFVPDKVTTEMNRFASLDIDFINLFPEKMND